jgi:PKD repeat protein
MKKILGLLLIFATLFIVSCQKQPKASFDVGGSNFKTGESINFTNTSEDAASFEWNFGDGTKSTDKNPSHSFATQGSYLVTLTAFSKNEKKKSSASNSVSITATNTGGGSGAGIDFNYSPSNPTVGDLVSFSSSGTDSTVSWDFGDGGSSNSLNPSHTFNSAGNFQVSLTDGSSNKTKTIVVASLPTNNIPGAYSVTENCNTGNYNYSSNVTAGSQSNTYVCSNFGGYNVSVNIIVNGNTISVPSQTISGGTFSGSGNIVSSTSFVINYSVTDGVTTETCTSTYTK